MPSLSYDTRLLSQRLVLSPLLTKDMDELFYIVNDPVISKWIYFMEYPMTRDQAMTLCRQSEDGIEADREMFMKALHAYTGQTVGHIGLHRLPDTQGVAETGFWVGSAYRGNGYAGEMLTTMIDFAFRDLKLESVIATASPDNHPSYRLLKRCGFQHTGDNYIYHNNEYIPRQTFAIQK